MKYLLSLIGIVLAVIIVLFILGKVKCAGEHGTVQDPGDNGKEPYSPGNDSIREPAVAGGFYSGSREELEREIDRLFSQVPPQEAAGEIVGIVSPHAGYIYSGKAAAQGFSLLRGQSVTRVIILAPTHYARFRGASIPSVGSYRTPLGLVPVDTGITDALLQKPLFDSIPQAHEREHSLEVQLPFCQKVLDRFQLVPVVIGELYKDDYDVLADTLLGYVDRKTIVVASTDFTHYGLRFGYVPFVENIRENLSALDQGAIDRICEIDFDGFTEYLTATRATVCGRRPVGILLKMLAKRGGCKARLLDYYTSGDLAGDYSNSVSYASIIFTGGRAMVNEDVSDKKEEAFLTKEEKETLLQIARQTLQQYVKTRTKPDIAKDELTERLTMPAGAFVTLHKQQLLRGCIGYIEPRKPLYQTVMDNAINAGLNDWRFSPVTEKELGDIEIEISVLTPTREIGSLEEFIIGTHGIILEKQGRNAVFLPQVAPEQGWDREETVVHLCRKAGLPPDAWKEGATFKVFSAEVFSEGSSEHSK